MSKEEEFDRNFDSLMKRLMAAGIVKNYSKTRTPCIVWNQDYNAPLGGQAAFVGLAMLLADICREKPLSKEEQALIQMIRSEEAEDPSPSEPTLPTN